MVEVPIHNSQFTYEETAHFQISPLLDVCEIEFLSEEAVDGTITTESTLELL